MVPKKAHSLRSEDLQFQRLVEQGLKIIEKDHNDFICASYYDLKNEI